MIMQNSYLRMANSTRTSQLNIVQGDKSPIAFQLLDRRQQPITSINGQIAEISIFESKGMVLREFSESRVDDGVFTFHLEQVLNTGSHEMRVKVGDYYFPSDTGTFTFNILPAHDITTEIDPTNVQTIDLVIDALADEIIDYFYPILEQTTHEYFVENAPVFKGEAFTYEDFTPEQLTELSMKVATESKDEDGNTIVTFSDGTVVTVSKGDKGDKGDQGIQGIQGEIGRTGDKGDRGLTGLTGAKGEKGNALTYEELTPQQKLELKGEKGDKGDKGDPLKFADLTPEQREELQQEVDYSQVAQKDHTHELSEVNGLSTKLDAKANSTDHEALEQRVDGIADEEGNINAGTIPMAHDEGSASEATVRDSIYKLEDDLNTHAHTAEEIEGLSEKIADLSNAAPAVHTHAVEDVSGLRVELDSKASTTDVDDIATELDSKAEVNHTHTDKADTVHTHTTADIEGLDTKLSDLENNSGGVPTEHTHDLADVTGLQDELDDKADKNHPHTTADITGLDTKLSELENNSGGIPAEHTHDIADVTGLQGALNAKSDDGHTHLVENLQTLDSRGQPMGFNWDSYRGWIVSARDKLKDLDARSILLRNDATSLGNVYDALEKKALKTHTHKASDINYQWSHAVTKTIQEQLDDLRRLSGDIEHTHEISEVKGLVVELFNKADKEHNHEISEVTGLQTELNGKADVEHTHSGFAKFQHTHNISLDGSADDEVKVRHYVDNKLTFTPLMRFIKEYSLADTADKDHNHTTADITDLQATIDTAVSSATENKADKTHTHSEYAPTEHTHEMSNINGLTTELDNLKSSGVDAKTAISSAINSKGGSTTNTDTFDVMAQAIAGLSSGGSGEGGGDVEMVFIGGDKTPTKAIEVKGLSFAPDEMFFIGTESFSHSNPVSFYSSLSYLFGFSRSNASYWFASKDPSVANRFERNTRTTRTPIVAFKDDGIRVSDTNGLDKITGLMILYKKDSFDAHATAQRLYDNDNFRDPKWEYAVDVSTE